jgi:putative PIN family toxin of toxin-antitoxin system
LIVLDTNIVLDLFVFGDPATAVLAEKLRSGALRWIATAPMRVELERVLEYPQILRRLQRNQQTGTEVLTRFDAGVHLVDIASKACVTCKDPDDQKFIDLAVAHRAHLLSKDNAVLCMRKRLLTLGVLSQSAIK